MTSFFKHKTYYSKHYLAFIRTKPCLVHRCGGESIYHHPEAGGWGMKCTDLYCLPLCYKHHDEAHKGQETFLETHSIDLYRTIAKLEAEYIELLETGGVV